MIEPYQWLLKHYKEFGYKEENVGPASVDLCLGDVKVYSSIADLCLGDVHSFSTVQETILGASRTEPFDAFTGYLFYRNTFYLASTEEYIKVPPTHCAFINMRSSLARRGLGHKMAGFIDPGFEGQVTLELTTDVEMNIRRGERVVQIIYYRLSEKTLKPYTGKYLKQVGPTEAYKTL